MLVNVFAREIKFCFFFNLVYLVYDLCLLDDFLNVFKMKRQNYVCKIFENMLLNNVLRQTWQNRIEIHLIRLK